MNNDQREVRRKLRILQHADKIGDVSKTCRQVQDRAAFPFYGVIASLTENFLLSEAAMLGATRNSSPK